MSRTQTLKILREHCVVIPSGITFDDLRLQTLHSGAVKFNLQVLRDVWTATGYHPDLLVTAGTAEISAFIVRFFSEYVNTGGFVNIETAGIVGLLRDETHPGRRLVPN